MRIQHFSLCVSGASVRCVGLEVVPQPRVAVHVDGAAPRQARILGIVEHDETSQLPSTGGRRHRGIVGALGGPPNHRACVDVDLDVALHLHRAREVNAGGEEKHAAPGLGGDLADGLVDLRRFDSLAGVVNFVVNDVDYVRVAELAGILVGRLGKQQQPGAVEYRLFVEENNQVTRPIEVETARIPADLRLDAVGHWPYVAGDL